MDMKNKKNKMNEVNEFEKRVREEINKMHDDGLFNVFNDGKKVIIDADTFVELVGYKVSFNKIVSDVLQGATK
jgi:hypothetical protein